MEIGVLQDVSMLSLLTNASLAVKLVMGLLLVVSMLSWWQIFIKLFVLARAKNRTRAFEQEFWNGAEMNRLSQRIAGESGQSGQIERIFEAGFREYTKLKTQVGVDAASIAESAGRAMRAAYQREMDGLEANMSFLATVSSVSPYIGLFGTVWGVMSAFRSLSNVGQATLANIGPGIAEALITTAMGLFAAIPAMIAYNHYVRDIDQLAIRFDSFMDEFVNILQRQAYKR